MDDTDNIFFGNNEVIPAIKTLATSAGTFFSNFLVAIYRLLFITSEKVNPVICRKKKFLIGENLFFIIVLLCSFYLLVSIEINKRYYFRSNRTTIHWMIQKRKLSLLLLVLHLRSVPCLLPLLIYPTSSFLIFKILFPAFSLLILTHTNSLE